MDYPHVLVASAEAAIRRAIEPYLGGLGCYVRTAVSRFDCLFKLRAYPPDLLILAPPLLWGSETGVTEAMQHDPVLVPVPVLVLDRAIEEDSLPAALEFVAAHLADRPRLRRSLPGLRYATNPGPSCGPRRGGARTEK
jgi:CheY-like chemotaxis protein